MLRVASLAAACLLLAHDVASAQTSAPTPIPADQIGAAVDKQYGGDGLSIIPTSSGVTLRSAFQKLDGEATSQGLWVTSTDVEARGRLRLIAAFIRRDDRMSLLPPTGTIQTLNDRVVFTRDGLVEEYRTSADGIRQDFVLAQRPIGVGPLRVELALSGASAEATSAGLRLTFHQSRRELSYAQLLVTDAAGKRLDAGIEVLDTDRLAVRVDDETAVYPLRIDPTFSDADWGSMNAGVPGVNGSVAAILPDDGGNVYVGGTFTSAGTVTANGIARWDGSAWSALGTGMTTVYALAMFGGELYAGGDFDSAGGVTAANIARWNGSAWSAVGTGTMGHASNATVRAFLVHDGKLYVGGQFTSVGGVSANYIATWNGSAWSALGSGVSETFATGVYALCSIGTDIYAGGHFHTAGGVAAERVAKWNGTTWSALGSGLVGTPPVTATAFDLVAIGTDLYVGGSFGTAGGVAALNVAKWDGSSWSAVGSGVNFTIAALAVNAGNIYAGGGFSSTQSTPLLKVWNGSSWSDVSSDTTGRIAALVVHGGALYAGGDFYWMGGVAANFAVWNGSSWSARGPGSIPVYVTALCVSGTNLFAASANVVSRWDGSTWTQIGIVRAPRPGGGEWLYALAATGTDLYIGGRFSSVNGVSSTSVAKWNGTSWSTMASSISDSGTVSALAVVGSSLYAAGSFFTIDGVSASNIARWNGTSWSTLGTGTSGGVLSLAAMGTDLYAGGLFTTAGGVSASNIAKWNGSTWSALASGASFYVSALAVSGTTLYAGGAFTTAGGVTVNRVAKWNGSAWSALGSGVNGDVIALVANGDDLYAGGEFTTAGGTPANRIARWSVGAWSAIGSGVDNTVRALAHGSHRAYVGGMFRIAGTTLSPFLAYVRTYEPFTDDPIVSGVTVVRAAHITELRTRINTRRVAAGLSAFVFTDATLTTGATSVRAQHILELRSALVDVYSALGMSAPTFTDPSLPTASVNIKAVHITELRTAVIALEP